jgi:hypothetical protein
LQKGFFGGTQASGGVVHAYPSNAVTFAGSRFYFLLFRIFKMAFPLLIVPISDLAVTNK